MASQFARHWNAKKKSEYLRTNEIWCGRNDSSRKLGKPLPLGLLVSVVRCLLKQDCSVLVSLKQNKEMILLVTVLSTPIALIAINMLMNLLSLSCSLSWIFPEVLKSSCPVPNSWRSLPFSLWTSFFSLLLFHSFFLIHLQCFYLTGDYKVADTCGLKSKLSWKIFQSEVGWWKGLCW